MEGAIKLSSIPSPSTIILHRGLFRIISVLGKLSKYSPQKDFQMRIEYSSFAVALCQLPFLLSINYPQNPLGYAAYECYSLGEEIFLLFNSVLVFSFSFPLIIIIIIMIIIIMMIIIMTIMIIIIMIMIIIMNFPLT